MLLTRRVALAVVAWTLMCAGCATAIREAGGADVDGVDRGFAVRWDQLRRGANSGRGRVAAGW